MTMLPFPAQSQPCLALQQREGRAGVRGSHKLQRRRLLQPLTLTLSLQAGRGDSGGTCLEVQA
jgi:hypothetical protein